MGKRMKDGRALVAVSSRTADVLDGTADLSSWDDEELLRGQRKDRNGRFTGIKPKVVPQAVHAERIRRTMSKAYDLLKESTYDAVTVLREVMLDEDAPTAYRVQAAELVLNRVLGKSTERLEVKWDEPPAWMKAIEGAVVGFMNGDGQDIIEAEVIADNIVFED